MEKQRPVPDGGALKFLYENAFGRILLKAFSAPWVSKAVGSYMNSGLSKPIIKRFIRKNGIDMTLFEDEAYSCFNDFFVRRIKPELRPVDPDPASLVCPCDGLLSVYRLNGDTVMPVKQSRYTLSSLLGDDGKAAEFSGGTALVFRLCPTHYHRYCFFDSGKIVSSRYIKGKLHTVRPVALEKYPVFCENCREITYMQTSSFGFAAQIEVGAMLVGKIANKVTSGAFSRGQEKGMFLYGGSTVIVLLRKDAAEFDEGLFASTADGFEIPVVQGMRLGASKILARRVAEKV